MIGFVIDPKYQGKKQVDTIMMHKLLYERARKKGYLFLYAISVNKKSAAVGSKIGLQLLAELNTKTVEFRGKKPLNQEDDKIFFGYFLKEL